MTPTLKVGDHVTRVGAKLLGIVVDVRAVDFLGGAAQRFRDDVAVLQRMVALPVQPGIIDLIRALGQQEKDTEALYALLAGATVDVTPAEYSPCGWGDCGPHCECGGSEGVE